MADKDNPNEFDEDEYQFESDDIFQFDDDDDEEFQVADDDEELKELDEAASSTGPSNYAKDFIEKLKNEGWQKNLMPLLIGVVVLLILIFSVYKLFSVLFSSEPPAKRAPTQITTAITDSTSISAENISSAAPTEVETLLPPEQTTLQAVPVTTGAAPEQIVNMQQKMLDLAHRMDETDKRNAVLVQAVTTLQTQFSAATAQMESLVKGMNAMQSDVSKLNNALSKILEAAQQGPRAANTAVAAAPIHSAESSSPVHKIPRGAPIQQEAMSQTSGQTTMSTGPGAMTIPGSGPTVIADESAESPFMTKEGNIVQPMAVAYYVQAMVPGRAWLKSTDGKIFTGAVGDIVPNYGRIVEINPEDGYILTENGTKIEYGIDQF